MHLDIKFCNITFISYYIFTDYFINKNTFNVRNINLKVGKRRE